MTPTKSDTAVRGLARMARRATDPTVSREAHLRGRERLLTTVAGRGPARGFGGLPRRDRPAWMAPRLLVAAAAALLLAFAVLWIRRPGPQLSFTVEGAPPGQGYIEAGAAGASARFSEGTRVALAPGARGRVFDVGARGARVSLEAGAARFDVVHRTGAEWIAEAGPFTVTVTGTAFDLSWSGARVEIVMHAGAVVVRGPPMPDGIVLRAGQRLVADAVRAEVSSSADAASSGLLPAAAPGSTMGAPPLDPRAASPASPAPGPSPAAPVTGALPPTASPAPSGAASGRSRSAPGWPARVAASDFAGVIAEAEARGIDAAIDETSLADLSALADAARYSGRSDLARRALVAERTRFPGSAEARSAAFLLGRLADTGTPAVAVTWYDRYLAEAPGGSLAAEALGRKMLALRASAGREAARPAAEEYRRRYPDGFFARAAGEILGDP